MERRSFLKVLGGSVAAIPFIKLEPGNYEKIERHSEKHQITHFDITTKEGVILCTMGVKEAENDIIGDIENTGVAHYIKFYDCCGTMVHCDRVKSCMNLNTTSFITGDNIQFTNFTIEE